MVYTKRFSAKQSGDDCSQATPPSADSADSAADADAASSPDLDATVESDTSQGDAPSETDPSPDSANLPDQDPSETPPGPSETDRFFNEDGGVREFAIEVDPADWNWLNEHAVDETYVPATVHYDGESYEASVRFKGNYGSLFGCFRDGVRVCEKLSLRLSFNEIDPAGRFMGLRKLNFNSSGADPTWMRERLTYWMYRTAGVPAGRTGYAWITVNGDPQGLFVVAENVDKEFLEDHFEESDGNLYKEVWPIWPTPEPYLAALKTNESTADVSRMRDAADRVLSSTDATFTANIAGLFDTDELIRHLVVDSATNNWDGITKFYCSGGYCSNHNFYLYDDPGTGLIRVIPWDEDHTFEGPDLDAALSWSETSAKLARSRLCALSWQSAPQSLRAPASSLRSVIRCLVPSIG